MENNISHGSWAWTTQPLINHPTPERRHVQTARGRKGGIHINIYTKYVIIVAMNNATSGNLCQESVNEEGGVIKKTKCAQH